MTQERTVSAVLDEQLESFLKSIGELERIESGNAICIVCGTHMTIENISLVVPIGGEVTYVCDQQLCVFQYALQEGVDA